MDYSLPGSSVHGVFQARVLEWVPLPSLLWAAAAKVNRHLPVTLPCSILCPWLPTAAGNRAGWQGSLTHPGLPSSAPSFSQQPPSHLNSSFSLHQTPETWNLLKFLQTPPSICQLPQALQAFPCVTLLPAAFFGHLANLIPVYPLSQFLAWAGSPRSGTSYTHHIIRSPLEFIPGTDRGPVSSYVLHPGNL